MSESFEPTHAIPAKGARAWADPDGTVPPVARFDGGEAVQVVEQRADWARVRRADGFTGWVDARQLVEAPAVQPMPEPVTQAVAEPEPVVVSENALTEATAAVSAPVPVSELAPVAAAAPATDGIDVNGVSIVTLLGAVAIAAGSFLDWWSVGSVGLSAFDIPLEYVITGKASDGFKLGPVLIALAIVIALPVVIGRAYPYMVGMLLGGIVIALAGVVAVRGVSQDPSIYPAVGMILALGGGAMALGDSTPFWNLRPAGASR